jgi:glutathione S-transferase
MEKYLEGVDWLVGNSFSGTDIQLSFVAEVALLLYSLDDLPNLVAFRDRCQNHPVYRRVLANSKPYAYRPKD